MQPANRYLGVFTSIVVAVVCCFASISNAAPTITEQPVSQTVSIGGNFQFNVTATGASTLTYQWYQNGTLLNAGVGSSFGFSGAQPGETGSYYVKVSDSTGSVTSSTVTLTVSPDTRPRSPSGLGETLSLNSEGFQILPFYDGGDSLFVSEWFVNGQLVPSGNVGVEVTSPGSYEEVVGNGAGAFSMPPTIILSSPAAPTNPWVAADTVQGVVYFAFSSPAQIQRYSMNSGAWLPTVSLPAAPTALKALSEGVYVAFGNTTSLYTLDLSSSQTVASTTLAPQQIFANATYVYLAGEVNEDPTYTAVNRSTHAIANTTSFQNAVIDGIVVSPSNGMAYGWTDSDLATLCTMTLNPDGSVTFPTRLSIEDNGSSLDQFQVVFSPDGSKVVTDSGAVYLLSSLQVAPSLGMPLSDACFLADGSPVALRGSQVTVYSPSGYLEEGSATLSSTAQRLFASGSTVYAFSAPTAAGGAVGVALVSESQMSGSPRAPLPGLTPAQSASVAMAPDSAFVGTDGVLYMLDQPQGNILRWVPGSGYESSIALTGIPFGMSYSPELNRIFVAYGDQRVTQIDLGSSTSEVPFVSVGQPVQNFLACGDELLLASGNAEYLVSSTGAVTTVNSVALGLDFTMVWNDALGAVFGHQPAPTDFDSFTVGGGVLGPINNSNSILPQNDTLIRFSADGTLLIDSAGGIYNTSSFAKVGSTGASPTDAAWIGTTVYTLSLSSSGTGSTLGVSPAPGYAASGSTPIEGTPLRLFPISGNRLLALTEQPTGPVETILDNAGNVLSQSANTAVAFEEPIITTIPVGVTVAPGGSVTLSATVLGGNLAYRWSDNGQTVSDAGPTLTLNNLTEAQSGGYTLSVQAYGAFSTVPSVWVYVSVPPVFELQPANQTAYEGSTLAIQPAVVSFPTATYQWYLNGSPIPGATSNGYYVAQASLTDEGTYTEVATNMFGSTTSAAAFVTIVGAPQAPQFTLQPVSASVGSGASAQFSAAAVGVPVPSYQWYLNGAPISGATSAELSLTSVTTAQAGIYTVAASNSGGTVTSQGATLSVSSVPATLIATGPASQSVIPGANVTFLVSATGAAPLTYQWSYNNTAIAGATSANYTLSDAQVANAGNYSVVVTGQGGSAEAGAVLSVSPASGSPLLQGEPKSQTVLNGSSVAFSVQSNGTVSASGASVRASSSNTYQWYFNGMVIPGATGATLLVSDASYGNAGTYDCLVGNGSGTTLSSSATLSIAETSDPGRLINLSCRAQVGTGSNILITGFVVGGQGTGGSLPVLIRSSGPALSQFGVAGILPDPSLKLFDASPGSDPMASNAGWGGNALVASAASAVGAFQWTSNSSLDSALVETLASGPYTAQTLGASGDTGVALAEIYDGTPPGTYVQGVSPRLINLSARLNVGTGSNELIAGFVIGGTTAKTVLIRASGPALTGFGVTGVLPDPQLQLFQVGTSNTLLSTRTAWGGDAQIGTTAASVGAFTWTNPASGDSAMLVTLAPGSYTANISGASGDTGVALVEIYEVP